MLLEDGVGVVDTKDIGLALFIIACDSFITLLSDVIITEGEPLFPDEAAEDINDRGGRGEFGDGVARLAFGTISDGDALRVKPFDTAIFPPPSCCCWR